MVLGDRPALTPVENFYQRMLADDPDEAEHQAETMLKDRSLTAYYDEVALKGLQLAANDALRGVLNDDKVHLIRDNVMALISDLSSHEDGRYLRKGVAGSRPSSADARRRTRARLRQAGGRRDCRLNCPPETDLPRTAQTDRGAFKRGRGRPGRNGCSRRLCMLHRRHASDRYHS